MLIRFEAPDGSVLDHLDQTLNPAALPLLINRPTGGFWFAGIRVDVDHQFLPAYRLAREVSEARH